MACFAELRLQRFDGAAMLGIAPVGPFVRLIESMSFTRPRHSSQPAVSSRWVVCASTCQPRSADATSLRRFCASRNDIRASICRSHCKTEQ